MSEFDKIPALVAEIPGSEGWWKSHNQEYFENFATTLVTRGFTAEEAVEFLAMVYTASADEFGN